MPVRTLQKAQARVQVSPMIIMVAWRWLQHSPMFGQAASSHTVTRLSARISARGLLIDRVGGRADAYPVRLALDGVVRPPPPFPGGARAVTPWSISRRVAMAIQVAGGC